MRLLLLPSFRHRLSRRYCRLILIIYPFLQRNNAPYARISTENAGIIDSEQAVVHGGTCGRVSRCFCAFWKGESWFHDSADRVDVK